MKRALLSLALGTLVLTAASAANARVSVQVGVSPFVYGGYVPPVVYAPDPYYSAPPPIVYFGGGSWGGDRDHDRGRGRDRGDRRGHDDDKRR
jgi:hypothetical protein